MDARLNELIRLKQPPSAPVQRWQMLPTRQTSQRPPRSMAGDSTSSPLRLRTSNVPNPSSVSTAKTPEPNAGKIRYKRSPKIHHHGASKTPSKTPSRSAKSTTPGRASKTPNGKAGKTKTPGRTSHTPSGCRFIPNRSTTDLEYSSYLMHGQKEERREEEEEVEEGSPGKGDYRHALRQAVSCGRPQSQQRGVLSFKATPSMGDSSLLNYTAPSSASFSYSSQSHRKRPPHKIPTSADRIMDAPSLVDDYYLNTLDWGKNNCVAVGLSNVVYIWNAVDNTVAQLMELSGENTYVSSLSWAGNGKYLAIGGSNAEIILWDVSKEKKVRVMRGHTDRVSALSWNSHVLASGCHDGSIHHHDVRKPEHCIARTRYHQLEVCGMKWSPDGRQLASGGNDNLVCIWNATNPTEPQQVLRGHQAAVKAVAWCPWQPNVLASGGGTKDKCIRLWNTSTGECSATIDTRSQVSSIAWNREYRELISSHGEPRNQLSVWKYPSMCKVGELLGHQGRVLHMCLSPRKTSVASASADETLRVWKCFEHPKASEQSVTCSEQDSILAMLHNASQQ